jgi:hypothetical protein
MKSLPHVAAQMGDTLRSEVERQLLLDLHHYSPDLTKERLTIDWSDACQEGHCTDLLGGTLEEMSDVHVRTGSGRLVADGWIDFVHGGRNLPLFVFWLYLDLVGTGGARRLKHDASIPQHVWERMPDESRDACAAEGSYDSRWARDPKVIAWRRTRELHDG